jgi:hypothetical protein
MRCCARGRGADPAIREVTTQPVDRLRRLALLLADGTGNYDFVHAMAVETAIILEGHVPSYEYKRRAEELARYVGFDVVHNALRVIPGED